MEELGILIENFGPVGVVIYLLWTDRKNREEFIKTLAEMQYALKDLTRRVDKLEDE